MNTFLRSLLVMSISGTAFANNQSQLASGQLVSCNTDIASSGEFFLSCGGHQGLSDLAEQIMHSAASVRCAPKTSRQTSETRLLAFLGTVMAEANFRCE